MQYNWKYRKYRNGRKASGNFDAVVPNKVHLRLHHLMWYPYTRTETPFKEVSLEGFQLNSEFAMFARTIEQTPREPGFIWREFKKSIFENWMHDKIHVIGASSGYDSRLIAKAVQELTKQHGRDWLGETYFVECAGEKEGFSEIMKSLGWTKNAISWIPDFNYEFFKNHSDRYNGLCAYPMNQWWDFYQQWNQEDIQYISGYGGNVADAMNVNSPYMGIKKKNRGIKGRLFMYFRRQYYYQISAFRQPKYSFHPFWSWRYINATAGCDHETPRTSVLLSELFVPECSHVKRMGILKEVTSNGHRTVKRSVVKKLHDWYMGTKFGKRYPSDPSNVIEYNKWWLMFCIAKYAEKNNISIN